MADLRFEDSRSALYQGDSRYMTELADNSVDCVVTSPAYLGLRKYKDVSDLDWSDGWRGSFGMEPTIEMYIEHSMVFIREIRRVLKPWGTVWWNLGDSRAGSQGGAHDYRTDKSLQKDIYDWQKPQAKVLKPLDMCLIPFRFALAAQAEGWYVRSDVIWHKPSTMPESINGWRWERHRVKVKSGGRGGRGMQAIYEKGHNNLGPAERVATDAEWVDCPGCPKCEPNDGYVLRKGSWRPTRAHEYIFMLTKTDRYYSDREAVAEPNSIITLERVKHGFHPNPDSPWAIQDLECEEMGSRFAPEGGRNLRSVWSMTHKGNHPKGHFAVFPEELPRKCIMASTSEWGNCPKCGMPWVRMIESKRAEPQRENWWGQVGAEGRSDYSEAGGWYDGETQTLGWRPSCKCGLEERVPAVVLDPFVGTGTTLWVAKQLGRRGVGYEISEAYCQMAIERNRQGGLL